ncbi:1878_t:CDS:2 [Funneliformis geosporum]|uniref:1878_t:CDS:1 n=1 Tax=Funneliformis geosporum TaxID=1117311 RepID=A0A9W4WLX9_9GLOM|nr:1878_t:CDS:2 [Funneliformis geosporum]
MKDIDVKKVEKRNCYGGQALPEVPIDQQGVSFPLIPRSTCHYVKQPNMSTYMITVKNNRQDRVVSGSN